MGELLALIDFFLKFLAHLKEWKALWRDLDIFAGFRIPSRIGTVISDDEAAKSTYFNSAAGAQFIDEAIEDKINDFGSLLLSKILFFAQCFDESRLIHPYLLLIKTDLALQIESGEANMNNLTIYLCFRRLLFILAVMSRDFSMINKQLSSIDSGAII